MFPSQYQLFSLKLNNRCCLASANSKNISFQVERTDYEGAYREGSGSEELGPFPPPPPPPDGKNCFCDKENCCNSISEYEKAAGRPYRGEKGERGPKVSFQQFLFFINVSK